MRTVEFFGLTRSAQDHFIDATNGVESPLPLARSLGGPTGHRAGFVVALAGVVASSTMFVVGFGDLQSPAMVHGAPWMLAWASAFVAVFAGLLHAMAGERARTSLPWSAGVYLFPSALIDARTPVLQRWDLDELSRIEGAGKDLTLHFGATTFRFSTDAATARAALEAMKATPSASLERDAGDPLCEPRMTSPLAPQHQHVHVVPAWVRGRVVLALSLAAALGPTLSLGRNKLSDDRGFASARGLDDVASYQAYLRNGVLHRTEVERTLLPRAELVVAKKRGTVDAIVAYEKAHPQSAIHQEVQGALRAALLAELAVVKKEGTLAALDAFERKRPAHGLAAQVAEARHDVYRAALASFRATVNDKDPAVAVFFERLLEAVEKSGNPKVEIRFRQSPSTTLTRADKYVTKQAMFNGDTSYPSHYYDRDKLATHEKALGKALETRLAAAFPTEILTFAVGAPLPEGDASAPATAPMLAIVHRPEWTGLGFPSQRPRGIFVGVQHHFDAQLRLPGDAKPLVVQAVIPVSVPLKVLKPFANIAPKPGEPETAVYSAMCAEAFEAFAARLLSTVFKS